jgi:amino acid adenylation domain-containing protein
MVSTASAQQRRIWRFHRGALTGPFCVRLVASANGRVDVDRLCAALNQAWSEDSSAASGLASLAIGGAARADGSHAMRCESIEPPRAVSGPDANDRLVDWLLQELERRWASTAPWVPLIGLVCRRSARRSFWALAASPLVVDAVALRTIVRRAFAIYANRGDSAASHAVALSYAAYAQWQQELNADAAARGAAAYWDRLRAAEAAPARLPGWKASGDRREFSPRRCSRVVAARATRALERHAAAAGSRLQVLLLAGWQTLLARRSGGESIEVGVLSDGRVDDILLDVRGPCARYLPVRTDIAVAGRLADVMARLDATMREHEVWQDGFSAEASGGDAGDVPPSHPFAFDWLDLRGDADGCRIERVHATLEPCDVRLAATRTDAGIVCVLEWDAARHDERDMAWLADGYLALLTAAAARFDGPLADLDTLGAAESSHLVARGNGGGEPLTGCESVLTLFARHAASQPTQPAILANGSHLTYLDVERRVTQLAAQLIAAGVYRATRVAVCLPRGADAIVSFLAALEAGGAFVPLDPAQPSERLQQMIVDANPRALVTNEAIARALPPLACPILRLDVDRPTRRAPRALAPDGVDPAQPAYVIYTSGSTGRPKGVVVSHRNLMYSTAARRSYYRRLPYRFLVVSPLAFDSAMAGIFWSLCQGGTLVLPAEEEHADPAALRRLIREVGVTHLLCLPSLYGWLLEGDGAADLRSLQVAIVAGEACPAAVVRRHHDVLPDVELHNEYGPTECTVWSTAQLLADTTSSDRVPIGRPISRARVYVAERPWRLAPSGVSGAAVIGGDGVADGYLDRPALTAERFVPDPWSGREGARAYRTGDRVRWLSDGSLDFLGRGDHQVKLRGYRIELEEIERAIAAHDDVRACTVVVRQDHRGQPRLVAYVVRRSGTPAPQDETFAAGVRAHAGARVPSYMVPAEIVCLADLPTNAHGKVDRAALARLPAAGAARVAPTVLPATPTETAIAALWSELLGRERIGRDENFFDIGGHSLLAIEAFQRLRTTLAPAIRLVDLFQYPTVRTLAAFVSPAADPASPPAVSADATDARARRRALSDKRRAARVS